MGPFICCSLGHMLMNLVAVLVHGANSINGVNGVNGVKGVAGVNCIGAKLRENWSSRKLESRKPSS